MAPVMVNRQSASGSPRSPRTNPSISAIPTSRPALPNVTGIRSGTSQGLIRSARVPSPQRRGKRKICCRPAALVVVIDLRPSAAVRKSRPPPSGDRPRGPARPRSRGSGDRPMSAHNPVLPSRPRTHRGRARGPIADRGAPAVPVQPSAEDRSRVYRRGASLVANGQLKICRVGTSLGGLTMTVRPGRSRWGNDAAAGPIAPEFSRRRRRRRTGTWPGCWCPAW
jgi:hypothetical protein